MSDSGGRFSIRPLAEADLDSVLAIADGLPDAPHWPLSVYRDILMHDSGLVHDSGPRRIARVAEDAGAIAGFAIASLVPPQSELESIAIAAVCQRCGLGRLLFSALEAELRSAGVNEVTLEVRASNHAARAFYGAIGFAQTGLRPRYYTDPVEDAILMACRLV
jgi:[ribosomal protein S18]-alanine N-acetyltransferase